MFKKLKGAFKAMKEKTVQTVNTLKNIVADSKNRLTTGIVVLGIGVGLGGGLIVSSIVELKAF